MVKSNSKAYTGFPTRTEWPTPELAVLVSMLEPGRALDLGCGDGTEAIFLAIHGWKVVGIDADIGAIRAAKRRALQARIELPQGWLKPSLRAVDARTYRESKPGTFGLVVDRLVYNNLFRSPDHGQSKSKQEYRRERHELIETAAYALKKGGTFLMRFLKIGGDLRWGVADPGSIEREDRAQFRRFFDFDLVREVGFMAMHTGPQHKDGRFCVEPKPETLVVLRRNANPCPKKRLT